MAAPAYTEVTHEAQYGESPKPEWYIDAKNIWRFRATRLLKCAWVDRAALIADLMTQAGGSYPHDDGTPYAYVRKITPRGRGQTSSGGTNLIAYSESVLEVYYDSAGPQWVNGSYITEAMVAEQFHIHPPGGNLSWTGSVKLTDGEKSTSTPLYGWSYTYTLGRMLAMPSVPAAHVGSCNATVQTCGSFNLSMAAQTVLYGPPSVSKHSEMGEGTRYTASCSRPINPYGWNKFFRAETNAWESLYLPNGNVFIRYPLQSW